jgi:hypothetical protein
LVTKWKLSHELKLFHSIYVSKTIKD